MSSPGMGLQQRAKRVSIPLEPTTRTPVSESVSPSESGSGNGTSAGVCSPPDLGVDVIGEVYRCRPARQTNHVALWREDVDLVCDQLPLEGFHKFGGVGGLLLPLHHTLEPREPVHLAILQPVLVHPVR